MKRARPKNQRHHLASDLQHLPLLKDVKESEQHDLLVSKLKWCSIVYDFLNLAEHDVAHAENKRSTLREITEYISTKKNPVPKDIYPSIFNMVSVNIFRTTAVTIKAAVMTDPDEEGDIIYTDPSWMHLSLVYDFFITFLDLPDFDPSAADVFINENFVVELLALFDSYDIQERECLKTLLHRVYGKFYKLRLFIRKQIGSYFLKFIYEDEDIKGVTELLEISTPVIKGLALPLKPEFKVFLLKVLIPLHKPRNLVTYYKQLSYIITTYLNKDLSLTPMVIKGLLKIWPRTCSEKQICFLIEFEDIMSVIEDKQFDAIYEPLIKKVTECIGSYHALVAEKALLLWNNENFSYFVQRKNDIILPIILPVLYKVAETHWKASVVGLAVIVQKHIKEDNPELFNSIMKPLEEEKEKAKKNVRSS